MSESDASVSQHDPLKAVADAMEAAVQAAQDGASSARDSAARFLPEASSMLARAAYSTCYGISYGLVFPSVLVARSIPQNNPLIHGLVDGAHAARDMISEMKASKTTNDL